MIHVGHILESELLSYPLDSDGLLRKKKAVKRVLLEQDIQWLDKRIAVLGGSTTNDIQDCLELFLLQNGIRPSFYASEYNRYWENAIFGSPGLETFSPDIIFIHTTSRNILRWPVPGMEPQEIDALLQNQFEHFRAMWSQLSERYRCPIIQNNFERPPYRLMGNRDISDCCGKSNFIYRLNGLLYDYAGSHTDFFVHDIDYLAAQFGLSAWQDQRYWSLYKYGLSLKAIPEFARDLSHIICSIYGKSKKAVTLDLDNTLWGGVVGDDGVNSLIMGPETPAGESFTTFQEYLRDLKQLGVLLTVNSKNEQANALAGLRHPSCVLKPEDFAHIAANWLSKDVNMIDTAHALNLGLSSFVFVDDNPAEREIVRSHVPEVTVLDGSTPERFLELLDHSGFFEVTILTKDDLARSEMYRANALRTELEQSCGSYQDYLLSLDMRACIHSFTPVYMQRIAQLTNKSNQFNLTTKRCTESDIQRMAQDPTYITLCGQMEDKFGDNGVVAVAAGRIEGRRVHIELWLMSCRVLKRDMELAMFDRFVDECLAQSVDEIIGYYVPTSKNSMVRELYGQFGFDKTSEDEQGNTVWTYYVKDHIPKNKVIRIV